MAEWLSSARKKKIRDIRSFIPVHGKILKPKPTSLNLESSSGVDYQVSETLGALAPNSTSGGKQLSLTQISKHDAAAKGMFQKVPASLLSTGIRRKTASTATTNETQEEVFIDHRMADKENFDSESNQVAAHTSPLSCHRELHTELKQQRSPKNKSTAILGKHKMSDHELYWVSYPNQRHHVCCDKLNECLTRGSHTAEALEGDESRLRSCVGTSPQKCTRQAAQASEATPNPSPPAKRLRTEHDYSLNTDSCGKVKITCSHERKPVRVSTDWKDNEVEHILLKHKQVMAHGTRFEVQTVCTSASRSSLQFAVESDIIAAGASASTLPVKDSQLGCISNLDTSDGTIADVADAHLASTTIEGFLWGSEPVAKSQGMFSCSTSNNIDTDELLAELSNCEKIV